MFKLKFCENLFTGFTQTLIFRNQNHLIKIGEYLKELWA